RAGVAGQADWSLDALDPLHPPWAVVALRALRALGPDRAADALDAGDVGRLDRVVGNVSAGQGAIAHVDAGDAAVLDLTSRDQSGGRRAARRCYDPRHPAEHPPRRGGPEPLQRVGSPALVHDVPLLVPP